MNSDQALQVLIEATANLPATRAQHAQINQAIQTLNVLIQKTKHELNIANAEKAAAAQKEKKP